METKRIELPTLVINRVTYDNLFIEVSTHPRIEGFLCKPGSTGRKLTESAKAQIMASNWPQYAIAEYQEES